MLEKPDIPDQTILARLREEYGLTATAVNFLPLGADASAAVYRVQAEDGARYFLKLTRRPLDGLAVELPHFLHAQGVDAVIAPLETRAGMLSTSLGAYMMILFPFIEGQDGYRTALSGRQWEDFGAALHAVHSLQLPDAFRARVPVESYLPRWRDITRGFLAQVETTTYADPVAAKLADFMQAHRAEIQQMVDRADQLGRELFARPLEFVLCHSDIHPGNLLITAGEELYIVDWDNPLFAPKEKDLALIGGCSAWHDPREALLFYRGYGPTPVDKDALAYFRYERIIMDIAAFGEQLLLSDEGGANREQAYRWFTNNFQPGGEIELARAIDAG